MAQFKGFSGNLMDVTPIKSAPGPGDRDLSISELSTTPQIRWMGNAAPETPGSDVQHDHSTRDEDEEDMQEDSYVEEDSGLQEGVTGTVEEGSFSQAIGDQSALEDEDATHAQNSNASALQEEDLATQAQDLEDKELMALKRTLQSMNKTVVALNGMIRGTVPKFQRMQAAIDTLSGLSKQYNTILLETERTAQVLEDPNWPGRTLEEERYQTRRAMEEERRRREEEERERESARQEAARVERERREKEAAAAKSSVSRGGSLRGRGVGRGSVSSVRGSVGGSTAGRGIPRPSGITRGHASGASVSSSTRGAAHSRTSSIPAPKGRYS